MNLQVGSGGMDPYSSPYIIPNNRLHNPFPHSLLRTRQQISARAYAQASEVCLLPGLPMDRIIVAKASALAGPYYQLLSI